MSNLTNFEQLKNTVDNTKIEYVQVTFPMTHLEDGLFAFANGFQARLSTLGAGYLSERLPQYKYRHFTKLANEEQWDEIAAITARHPHQLTGTYVAALFEGEIVGLMSHYNSVSHSDLLGYIQAAGLEEDVSRHWITQMELVVDLHVRSQCHDGLIVAMRIVNGHSGHSALRYRSVILADGYEWEDRVQGASRRHLSKVGLAIQEMQNSMSSVTDMKVDDRLMAMSADEALSIARSANPQLSVRQERLLVAAEEARCKSAMEVVTILGGYASTNGFKSSVQKLLDPVIEKALGR